MIPEKEIRKAANKLEQMLRVGYIDKLSDGGKDIKILVDLANAYLNVKGFPIEAEDDHTCELDCRGCVSSGWTQAITKCKLAAIKSVPSEGEIKDSIKNGYFLEPLGRFPEDGYKIQEKKLARVIHKLIKKRMGV